MDLQYEKHEPMDVKQRIIGIFKNPKEVFLDVYQKPNIFSALVIIILVNLFLIFPLFSIINEYVLLELNYEADVIADSVRNFMLAAGIIGAILAPVGFAFICGVLFKLYNLFDGRTVELKRFFAVGVYAYFPSLLSDILKFPFIFFTSVENFDMDKLLTSLYILLPQDTPLFIAEVAKSLDPFYIWSLYLVALGSAIAMKTKVKTTSIFLFSLWFGLVLISSFLAVG
ncbi:hypothetical protein SYNTR_1550 [Candidatus Syntrophocurvum alkaliphilum]|uniref:Yip1 domain-containing protein n=1 Tax=Candidatus Syntrophocurvum alkaliphilum TaxID=2293317 RepID=A0A6I6DJ41_9FIRM|nr:YIP1 family protein [Candidatus Syntrophocurvum alkaliphilum]QGU00144.1 hypothetical protein SYNTR_1550 [Candidatus Syntrophocurvum alkaliphilum]